MARRSRRTKSGFRAEDAADRDEHCAKLLRGLNAIVPDGVNSWRIDRIVVHQYWYRQYTYVLGDMGRTSLGRIVLELEFGIRSDPSPYRKSFELGRDEALQERDEHLWWVFNGNVPDYVMAFLAS